MTQLNPFTPVVVWRRGLTHPAREAVEVDVHDGRAEYSLSGPYRMAEGAKIEVIDGKLLFTGSSRKIS